jgi:Flp pilus assembly protein CpaB
VSRPAAAPTDVPQRNIVVAAENITARTVITTAMLRTDVVTDDPALDSVLSDPADVVGSLAAIAISAGDPITASMFAGASGAGLPILGPLETVSPDSPLWRAVSVLVPADRAVAGMIGPADHIDLFVTLSPQLFDASGGYPVQSPDTITDPGHIGPLALGYYSDMTTKLVWSNLEVLAVDENASMYVIKVDEHQAEEIAHIQATGASFTIALRPGADSRDVDRTDYGQTTNRMIEIYGFLIPDMIEIYGSPAPASPAPAPTPAVSPAP